MTQGWAFVGFLAIIVIQTVGIIAIGLMAWSGAKALWRWIRHHTAPWGSRSSHYAKTEYGMSVAMGYGVFRSDEEVRRRFEEGRRRELWDFLNREPWWRRFTTEGETVKPMATGGDPIKVDNAISVHGVPEHIRPHLASLIRRLAAGSAWQKVIEDMAAPFFAERVKQRKDAENRTARTGSASLDAAVQIRHEFYNAMGVILDDSSRIRVEAFIRDVYRKGWTMAVHERADFLAKADLNIQFEPCVTGPLGSPVVHHGGAQIERDAAEAAAHTAKVRTRREELGHQLLTYLRVGTGMDRDKRHAHQLGATMEALVRSVVETVLDRRAEKLAEVDKTRGRPKIQNILHRLTVAEGHINRLVNQSQSHPGGHSTVRNGDLADHISTLRS